MVETIRALGFKPRVSGHHITFASKELWLFLQSCGDGAEFKQVPGWIKALDPSLLEELFQALLDGDGTRSRDGMARKFYSTSKTLADDVCELALKLGYSATITWRPNRGFGGRTARVSSIYHVSLSRELLRQVLPSGISSVPYDGLVYCLTVPNHLVFARRNGKAVWSGNCGYAGWHEWYAITTPRSKGIPKDSSRLVVAVRVQLDLARSRARPHGALRPRGGGDDGAGAARRAGLRLSRRGRRRRPIGTGRS